LKAQEAETWKEALLEEIFIALSKSEKLRQVLIFKGARVLNKLLDTDSRRSLDIDSNLTDAFVNETPNREEQRQVIETLLNEALVSHFDSMNVVRYTVEQTSVKFRPTTNHPMGWNGFDVKVKISDLTKLGERAFPNLTLDVAAPENLTDGSIQPLNTEHGSLWVYTLHRIAGEKARAFLSSLPIYRKKYSRPGGPPRAKDLFDLARIIRAHPIEDVEFWKRAGFEFVRACESRHVDCNGMGSFSESLSATKQTYESDSTIPDDISFDVAWSGLTDIVETWSTLQLIPFSYSKY